MGLNGHGVLLYTVCQVCQDLYISGTRGDTFLLGYSSVAPKQKRLSHNSFYLLCTETLTYYRFFAACRALSVSEPLLPL